jgi:FlaA1/EpsC-like NDP-sugar epimerase
MNLLINWRSFLAFVHDLAACAVAWLVAFWLRFNFEVPDDFRTIAFRTVPWVVALYGALFLLSGLYRGIWRFASLPDLSRILVAVAAASLGVAGGLFMTQTLVPRSVLVMSPVFLIVIMGGSRLAYRAWKERSLQGLVPRQREPVFVIGAGDTAINLIKELARSPQWHVVGVLHDDPTTHGRELHGVRILGRTDHIERWKGRYGVGHAIIAMPRAQHDVRRRIVAQCTEVGVKVLTVPSFDDLITGRVTVSQIRNVELDDLLGRDPVMLDTAGMNDWISDRTVMITGAGGSIGSELCRQIARYAPRQLILFELNEFALYSIEQEFGERFPQVSVVCAIGDVKDEVRVNQIMAAHQPSVVFHAAAYKHVPLMENDNAWQAVLNNVGGTLVAARAATEHRVEKFVLVSTDKAVNPANVMGASKRLAEMACQALEPGGATRFVMVRFGNVLGSTGSVIPKFRAQIARGGPVTVTHPEITRYFMSIPEAVQLVMQAGLMGKGGEIVVLDMGEPVKIADLARELIRLSGYAENDIKIVYTGLRPGEKLYEELLAGNENTLPTPHPKLRVARARIENGTWLQRLDESLGSKARLTDVEVRRLLAQWVPEYRGAGLHDNP